MWTGPSLTWAQLAAVGAVAMGASGYWAGYQQGQQRTPAPVAQVACPAPPPQVVEIPTIVEVPMACPAPPTRMMSPGRAVPTNGGARY